MKKKTIKSFEKLSPIEKVATVAFGVAVFPVALTLSVAKDRTNKYNHWGKYKKKRRRRR